VPAPDMNTRSRDGVDYGYLFHARGSYDDGRGDRQAMELGGSRGRPEATGRGCMLVTLEALKRFGLKPEDTRVVIQGFGNVGGMAAKLMAAHGFKIVAIVEYDAAVYNRNGLDIKALALHRAETGSIAGFPEAEAIDRKEALFLGMRRSAACRDGERDHLRECRAAALPHSLRGRQRAHHGYRRRDSGR